MPTASRFAIAAAAFGASMFCGSAFAHHSFSATYDAKKPITIEGVVSKMSWRNPHAFLYVDVKDSSGKSVTWEFELSPSAMLLRYGWTPNLIKTGDSVTVRGFQARDGTLHLANARDVTLPDGRTVLAGPGAGADSTPGKPP